MFIIATDSSGDGRSRGAERHLEPSAGIAASQRHNTDGRVLGDGGSQRCAHLAHSSRNGWDEGRPDAAVSGDGPGVALLPTPQARDWKDANSGSPAEIDRHTPNRGAVSHYLPTPSASDGTGGGQHPDRREGHSRQICDYALMDGTTRWGKYGPAIARWEQLTRPAPAPTEPNSKGNPRLNAAFSEWMMGWPAGWVTDVPGIKRNDALRIVGNGVCPQQAIAALRYLLSVR